MDDIALDDLGAEIRELAAHIAAADYRWLRLLSAFDRREGWKEWGVRSCAHWLNWKCGLDLRSAREKVRVARALDDLDEIAASFSRGEISYSKVRAITRIATKATERDLLILARHATTQQVEKIVRGYRRSLPVEDANARHDRRYVQWRYADDGSVQLSARLDPEEGRLVIEALRKVREEVRAERQSDLDLHDGSREPRRSGADALVEIARRELAGGAERTSAGDRYTVVVQVDAKVLAGGEGDCQLESGPALAAATAERMICDGAIVPIVMDEAGETLSVGRKTRRIPTSIKRALVHRDGCCQFPGCFNKAYVDGHHIVPWVKGGETSLANLVLLCGFHHRFVHEGGVKVSVEPNGRFTFTRANGWVIETAALSVEPGGVLAENASLGLEIDDTTIVPRWWNDPCDYSTAIDGLIRKNESLAAGGMGAESGSAEPLSDGPIPIELDVLCRSG